MEYVLTIAKKCDENSNVEWKLLCKSVENIQVLSIASRYYQLAEEAASF